MNPPGTQLCGISILESTQASLRLKSSLQVNITVSQGCNVRPDALREWNCWENVQSWKTYRQTMAFSRQCILLIAELVKIMPKLKCTLEIDWRNGLWPGSNEQQKAIKSWHLFKVKEMINVLGIILIAHIICYNKMVIIYCMSSRESHLSNIHLNMARISVYIPPTSLLCWKEYIWGNKEVIYSTVFGRVPWIQVN